jgi:tight adherence protein C
MRSIALVAGVLLLSLTAWGAVSAFQRERSRRRLLETGTIERIEAQEPRRGIAGWLTRRLALAGFRRPGALVGFDLATAAALVLACLVVTVGRSDAWNDLALGLGEGLPPPVDSLVGLFFFAGPWAAALGVVVAPWSFVARTRERRVAEVERDLPVTLELLATLGEAGLAFDAAVSRLLDSQPPGAALAEELRLFQRDSLSGTPRTDCFRRLAERLDVEAVTILCSAMVQAEQVGSGTAAVLRQQADDLRLRRRERALALAEALPIKLVLPLALCFLPGIFVWTLGPAFHQLFEVLSQATGAVR